MFVSLLTGVCGRRILCPIGWVGCGETPHWAAMASGPAAMPSHFVCGEVVTAPVAAVECSECSSCSGTTRPTFCGMRFCALCTYSKMRVVSTEQTIDVDR
eukprot:1631777-Pyramimonas_sp.AAC.2